MDFGRAMYIWKLAPVLSAEGGANKAADKAKRAKLSSIWVKVAEGQRLYRNATGETGQRFAEFIKACHEQDIKVWGWQVPRCPDALSAQAEGKVLAKACEDFDLEGGIVDIESEAQFFQGGLPEAQAYAKSLRAAMTKSKKKSAISSHDIPGNFRGFPPKFDAVAEVCDYNFPQTYYGGSPSVAHRLNRAEAANAHHDIPFIPVGAGWIGENGGCASASACAERAREFIRLAKDRDYEGYSFWHWGGAPMALWEVLNATPV